MKRIVQTNFESAKYYWQRIDEEKFFKLMIMLIFLLTCFAWLGSHKFCDYQSIFPAYSHWQGNCRLPFTVDASLGICAIAFFITIIYILSRINKIRLDNIDTNKIKSYTKSYIITTLLLLFTIVFLLIEKDIWTKSNYYRRLNNDISIILITFWQSCIFTGWLASTTHMIFIVFREKWKIIK